MNNRFISLMFLVLLLTSCTYQNGNRYYHGNPEPLLQNSYIRLPLGSVLPSGWLKSQLEIQAAGLTGNLDEFWSDLVNSAWKGGPGEAWERGPYWLDGLVPLAYLLDDKNLIEKANNWVNKIIESSSDSGWYGPSKNKDRWPLAVANKVLMQYYEATGDKRAIEVLIKYFRYLHNTPPDWPDSEWRGVRAMENAVTGYWLYRHIREPWILETIESIQKNSSDWTTYYEKFPWDSAASAEKRIPLNWKAEGLTAHVVNNAMAIKYPALWYQQSKDPRYKNAVYNGISGYDKNHGQAGGRFSGDEHLSGKSPERGTELCSVVEYMYSLETLYEILGDNKFTDRLEMLAYNSLPGTTTPDMWAHQYDQQSNQVLVSAAKRDWSTNGDFSNIYGLKPNFACCLANMHQGWPKFIESLWMATNDNGLVLAAYGPSIVKATVGNGVKISITEETDYPFSGHIKLIISSEKSVKFPLYFRVPGWGSATITYREQKLSANPGSTVRLENRWKNGDTITVDIPLKLRYEARYNNSLSILRGPVCFALRIDKEYKKAKTDKDDISYKGSVDWEILPKSDWNWGLIINKENLMMGNEIITNNISQYPFADKGDMVWSSDSSKYFKWTNDPPVLIKIRGMQIKDWIMINNSAGDPPVSPVKPQGKPAELILVPYGCTRLRITEFPVMDIVFMTEMTRPDL
jgi:hypothetical protein